MNRTRISKWFLYTFVFSIMLFFNNLEVSAAKYDVTMVSAAADINIDEEDVYSAMVALKDELPEGTPYDNSVSYYWNGGLYSYGNGCAAFAFRLSDAAFGDLPARFGFPEEYNSSNIKVGDILRVNNDTHSVIVLEVKSDRVVIAEGNYSGTVHWGREITYDKLNDGTTSNIISRYPESISTIKTVYVSKISLSPSTATINVGDSITVTPTIYPSNASNHLWSVNYKSNYVSIRTSGDGITVTALKPGETIVKFIANDNSGVIKEFKLTIRDESDYVDSPVKISSLTNTDSGIKIKWTLNENATGYYLYRSTDGKNYSKIKTISKSYVKSYVDKNANVNGKKYLYKIVAYKKLDGKLYNSVRSAARTHYYLKKVTSPSLRNIKTNKISIKWSKNKKASGYEIQYSKNNKFSKSGKVSVSGASKNKKTISKLPTGSKYYVRIRAYKTVKGKKYYSEWSDIKKVNIIK